MLKFLNISTQHLKWSELTIDIKFLWDLQRMQFRGNLHNYIDIGLQS